MAYIKDEIEIPGRKKLQGWLFGIGAISGILAYAAYDDGSGKGMLICGAICVGLFYIGANLKTTKKLRGTISKYQ